MPEPLEDKRGTDMPATKKMFFVIAVMLVLALVVLAVIGVIG